MPDPPADPLHLLPAAPVPIEPQICQATCAIMKLSFDEEYRRAMNELGERGEGAPSLSQLSQLGRGVPGGRRGGSLAQVTPHPVPQEGCRRWPSCCRWTTRCTR